MSQDSSVVEVLGPINVALTILLFLSPIKEMRSFYRLKSVGEYRCELYVLTWVTCGGWIVYAVDVGLTDPKIANGCGFAASSMYSVIYMYYALGSPAFNTIAKQLVASALLLLVAFAAATHFNDDIDFHIGNETFTTVRALVFGTLCIVLNVGMYAAPLSAMRKVVETKSVEFFPLAPSLLTLLVSLLWTIYSLLVGSLAILVPNAAGIVVGVLQVGLWLRYRGSTPAAVNGGGARYDAEAQEQAYQKLRGLE